MPADNVWHAEDGQTCAHVKRCHFCTKREFSQKPTLLGRQILRFRYGQWFRAAIFIHIV